jgi:hypothetical protein
LLEKRSKETAGTQARLRIFSPVVFQLRAVSQLREYLTLLVENGLIEYEVGQTYRTTEKGMRVLHLQNEIDEVAPVSFIKE